MREGIVPFGEARVGEYAHTWENRMGGWGEYRFETSDPEEWHDPQGLREVGPVVRKTWLLIEEVLLEEE